MCLGIDLLKRKCYFLSLRIFVMITREADCSFSFPMKIRLHFAEQWGKGAKSSPSLRSEMRPFLHCSGYVEPETYVLFDGKQVRKSNEATKDRQSVSIND